MRLPVVFLMLFSMMAQETFASNLDNLDSLLDDYYVAADLSSKTKNESLGTLFLFTANDLDKMLATKLSDVLTQVPVFAINYNNRGDAKLNLNGTPMNDSLNLRLFIDDQEVSNPINGDALAAWADMSLDFVSHIEVYLASAAFDLDTDPAIMIVRVYSNAPERQKGGIISQLVDSDGGYTTSAYYANVTGKNYYSLFASFVDKSLGDIDFNGTVLDADKQNKYILGSYSYNKKLDLQFGYVAHDSEMLWSNSFGTMADELETEYEQAYISAKMHLLDDGSLVLYTGYNRLLSNDITETYLEGILPVSNPYLPLIPILSHDSCSTFDRVEIGVEKIFETPTNKLSTSFKYERNSFDIDEEYINAANSIFPHPTSSNYTPFDRYDKYIFKLEDSYNISNHYLLSGSVRYDMVTPNNDAEDFGELSYKIGLIANPIDPLVMKFFYMHSSIMQPLYVVAKSSEDLKSTEADVFSLELKYEYEKSIFRILAGQASTENLYSYDANAQFYINAESVYDKYRYLVLAVEHNFTNQIGISGDISKSFDSVPYATASDLTINIRGSYSHENWMFYAQASYSPGYTSESVLIGLPDVEVDEAFDLNLGVRYKFSENLSLDFKAYNILGEAAEVPYLVPDFTGLVMTDTVAVQSTKVEAIIRWRF